MPDTITPSGFTVPEINDLGAQLMTMGIEGVTYNLREDGKAEYVGHEGERGVGITELESE